MTDLEMSARAKLAAHSKADRCDENCPGWAVFADTSDSTAMFEIERCDECWSRLSLDQQLTDDEAAALPEAQAELVATVQRLHDTEHLNLSTTPTRYFADVCPHCAALEKEER